MTVKKSNAKVANVKYTAQEVLASEVGDLVGQVGTINKTIDEKVAKIRQLRKNKPIGTLKGGDAVMVRFHESQVARGLAEQTIKNNCTTFRKAVNEGRAYDVNAHRKGSKGAKATKSGEVGVKLTIKGEPTADEVSKALREIFNAEKFREQYAELASFMTDALDEYDGE
jgi:hypothetical protein